MSTPSVANKVHIPTPPKRPLPQRLLRWALFLALSGGLAGLATVAGAYLYYAPTLPEFSSLRDYQPKLGSQMYSADGQLIAEFSEERRVLVPFERIPPRLTQAFMSAEDKRFYDHWGVDPIGLTKAIVDKVLHPGSKLRGASTITQQVAKGLLATQQSFEEAAARTIERKVREAFLAFRLESVLTKSEIMYMYVSQIFLGNRAYGVQAAAEHYFQKNVWELSLAEMATLAGLPQRPSDYSPVSRPEAARGRRKYVLGRMLTDGYISQEEHDEALKEVLDVHTPRELYLQVAPYYTEQVRREIVDRYGERALTEDGLKIYTTMNMGFQNYAQKALTEGLYDLDKRQGFRGPLANLSADKRQSFFSMYRKELGLEEGDELAFEMGKIYLAVVEGFAEKNTQVKLNIAGREGILPLAGMRWARKPNPTERVDLHYLKDVRKALRKGDIITVSRTTRYRLGKDRHGWEAIKTVPKDSDEFLFKLEQEPIAQAAVMSVDPRTGYVVAQVGGYHFEESSFNRATQACREPGSSFKPIVYSAAIDKLDYTASTLVDDKPLVFDDPDNEARWKPNNAENEFRGAIPLRTCLQDSINIPAIRIANAVGIDDIITNARNLGLTSPVKRELGTALGSSCTYLHNLVRVYTTLNRYGERQPMHFVRRVVDRWGNILEDNTAPSDPTTDLATRLDRAYATLTEPRKRALDEQTAFLTVSLMENVVENGTGMGAKVLGVPVAGKTGTTNDSYDAWFMGFTRNMVTGVWVGHDTKERPLGVSEQGGRTALPVWVDYMKDALTDYTGTKPKRINHGEFLPPQGVVRASIDPDTGLLARPEQPSVYEWYRAGNEPTDYTPDQEVLDPNDVDIWGADTQL